ncbi:MAG TPA: RNA methyltransferase [Hyphomicrobiaceae bacterium]|nr:RNA methyltransferase [Hyphomicrobiaceae bacterium]
MTSRFEPGAARAPRVVTSLQNEQVKFARSLRMRKVRRETGLFLVEGAAIIISARDAGWQPRTLIYAASERGSPAADKLVAWAGRSGADCLEVSEAVLAKLASKENPQSVMAVFEQRWAPVPDSRSVPRDGTWLVLEEVRDPGNLGTIIRTADAVGAQGVVLVGPSCDPYSPEATRATMGSIFSVPLVRLDRPQLLEWVKEWPGDVVGTHLSATSDFRSTAYRGPTLLAMGSEGSGMSNELMQACTKLVKIPMAGRLDSLNLAIATALALYQIRGPFLKL